MTEHHHDNPVITICISMAVGLTSWAVDPDVYRTIGIALACGFVGGLGRAAGAWAWTRYRERKNASK